LDKTPANEQKVLEESVAQIEERKRSGIRNN
jgi:hypothetical protein